MTENLENELYSIDPVFFEEAVKCIERSMNQLNTCMYWGCECGDGWFEPLKKFVHKTAIINELAKKYDVRFIANQIKEKWGSLRIYYSTINGDEYKEEYAQNVNILSDMFEDAYNTCVEDCSNVCERCGKFGGYNNENLITTSGWISIICRDCAKKKIEESTNRFDQYNKDEFHNIPRITLFKEAYDFLNINHKAGFKFRNEYYSSIPLAYFCTVNSKNKDLYRCIDRLNDKSSAAAFVITETARKFGYQITDYLLLKEIIKAKFTDTLNNTLLSELLETKDKLLINMNKVCDNTLGYCVCNKCKNKSGENIYGKLLMEFRGELKSENK